MDTSLCSVVLLGLIHLASSFNVQDISKAVVFTSSKKGIQFGYSVALHENSKGKWLLVGAPKDYEGAPLKNTNAPRDGALYSCRMMERKIGNPKVTKKGKCYRLNTKASSKTKDIILTNDFESTNFTQLRDDDFDWTLQTGPSFSKFTGPPYDHTVQNDTVGKYMLLECSSPRTAGETARLSSPILPPTNAVCVRFWYHMYGEKMGSLNLYVFTNTSGSRMVWSLAQEQGNVWHEGRTTVISHEPFQIIFEGVVGQDYNSDIGLDDIIIMDGVCPEDIRPVNQSLGMTVARNKINGQIMACAPTWSYTCKERNHATGLCYLFDESLAPSEMQMMSPCRNPSCNDGSMDLVFLIDGSDSITKSDFKQMIRWLNNVVSSLPLGRDLTRVGIAQYAAQPKTEFFLNQYYKLEDMRSAIRKIKHVRGTTLTGRAIDFISENLFMKERGMRPDAKHVAVVITDGKSYDNVIQPSTNAKAKGITIFSIGIGSVTEEELRNISSDPDDQFVYLVTSYKALDGIRDQLQKKLFSLESQGGTVTTEQCQAGIAAGFLADFPVIGLPGLNDWSGGFALYSDPESVGSSSMIRTSFQDLLEEEEDELDASGDVEMIKDNDPVNLPRERDYGKIISSGSSSSSNTVRVKVRTGTSNAKQKYIENQYRNSYTLNQKSQLYQNYSLPKPQGLLAFPDHDQPFMTNLKQKMELAGVESGDELIKKMKVQSYMGYSMAFGSYTHPNAIELAISAPRMLNLGSVFIIQVNDNKEQSDVINEPVIMQEFSGTQMGSYFGYSICMTDMNSDGLDEVLIGAPLWMDKYQDMGMVEVYISKVSSSSVTHQKIEIFGSSERSARFGFSIADAGDLNQDGFKDVVIGAPGSTADEGAVYIYNGGTNLTSRFQVPSQIVRASGTKKILMQFGFSLHGGLDIDDNGYPDIACSAPGNDKAVVLFTRPVFQVKVQLTPITPVVNVSNPSCDILLRKQPKHCTRVQICFSPSGYKMPFSLDFDLNADVDYLLTRAFFLHSSKHRVISLISGFPTCFNETLVFKDYIRDLSTDMKLSLNFSLSSQMPRTEKSPMLDANDENPVYAKIAFARDCQSKYCKANLVTECAIDTPQSDSKVILGENRIISVVTNLSNIAQDAYNVQMKVVHDKELYLVVLNSFESGQCIVITYDEDDKPSCTSSSSNGEACEENRIQQNSKDNATWIEKRTKTLELLYKDPVMRKNEKCSFKMQFGIHDNTQFQGGNISLSISSMSANEDGARYDNECNRTFPVYFETLVTIAGFPQEPQVRYGSSKQEEYISYFMDIGPEVVHSYYITNRGHSAIPLASIQIDWPSETKSAHDILYLTNVVCLPASKCHCKDLGILMNPDQLNSSESLGVELNRGHGDINFANSSNDSEVVHDANGNEFYETTIGCNTKDITCEILNCVIAQLQPSETINIILKFRLWQSTLVGARVSKALITTSARISAELSPYFLLNTESDSHMITSSCYSNLGQPVKTDVGPVSPRIWVIVLSFILGIVLLALTVLALRKAGFFESKYKMKKDETLEWRDFGQPSAHADRITDDPGATNDEAQQRLTTFQRGNANSH